MLTDTDLNQLLTVYPTLRTTPAALQHVLWQAGQRCQMAAGQLFFDIDAPCRTFALSLSGSIRVVRPVKSGREILLYRIQPGESCILTVSCLLGGETYQAKGVVESAVTAVTIPQSLFIHLIEQAPAFRAFIFQSFGQRLARLMALIEEVAFQRLDQRLAALLLARGPVIAATHQQLADELGSVREVIGRLLRNFQRQEAVVLERGHVRILNRTILRKIVRSEGDTSHRHTKGDLL